MTNTTTTVPAPCRFVGCWHVCTMFTSQLCQLYTSNTLNCALYIPATCEPRPGPTPSASASKKPPARRDEWSLLLYWAILQHLPYTVMEIGDKLDPALQIRNICLHKHKPGTNIVPTLGKPIRGLPTIRPLNLNLIC